MIANKMASTVVNATTSSYDATTNSEFYDNEFPPFPSYDVIKEKTCRIEFVGLWKDIFFFIPIIDRSDLDIRAKARKMIVTEYGFEAEHIILNLINKNHIICILDSKNSRQCIVRNNHIIEVFEHEYDVWFSYYHYYDHFDEYQDDDDYDEYPDDDYYVYDDYPGGGYDNYPIYPDDYV